ncbi:MAG TPA: hypothetical protein VGP64_06315 [Polyangia bacterium]|jgi:hypothetical protein
MNPQGPAESAPRRKPYEKPALLEVALRPEEAVLGSCKTMGVAGPAESDCTALGGCMTFGS